MGNCQAAEAETVVIMHPGNKIQRLYWSVSARHVMNSNPGHYVAVVVGARSDNGLPVKQLKLLRPDDLLLVGKVYRLVCVQDILKEFAAKKCVKLGKLLKERGVLVLESKGNGGAPAEPDASSLKGHMVQNGGNNNNRSRSRVGGRIKHHQHQNNNRSRSRVGGRIKHHQHQWKPILNSISENEN